jgi:succinate dehydrogenase/fumarate reductase-like Fe-S protein
VIIFDLENQPFHTALAEATNRVCELNCTRFVLSQAFLGPSVLTAAWYTLNGTIDQVKKVYSDKAHFDHFFP